MNLEFSKDENKSKEQLLKELKVYRAQLAVIEEAKEAQRKAEEALKISETSYQEIFDKANDAIFCDEIGTGRLVESNQQACEMFGYSKEEILKLSIEDLSLGTEPYTQESALNWIKKTVDKGPQLLEWVCKHKDGHIFPVEVNLKRAVIDGKDRVLAIVRDITARKQSEEKLKESEMLYRLIAISTSDAIWDWDLITNKVNRISGYKETYGYKDTKQLDDSISWWHKQIHPDDIERVIESINYTIKNKEKFWSCEYRHLKSDRCYAYVLDSGCIVFDENKKPIRMIGCTKNITSRKQAEEALKALNESLEHKVSERTQDLIKVNKELRVKVKAHQQALDVMKEQETGFRLLFTNNPNPMLVYDLKTLEIIEVNDTLIKNYGYTRDELLSMKITDIRPEEDIPKLIENVQKERSPLQFSGEWRHKLKNGEIIDVEITSHTADFNGRKAVIVSAKDITKRKEAEVALKESEEKYRSLINNIPDVTWTTDSEGNTVFVSPNVEKVYGFNANELYQEGNRHWFNRIHPEDLKKVKEAYGTLITKDKKFDVEYRIKRKDGEWIWIYDRAIATYEKNGKKYADGVLSDITIKKLEQKAIIESEERYRRLIETADDAIIGWSIDKYNVSWNKAAERIYGYTKEEIKNKHVSLIVPEDRKDEVNNIFEKIEKGERIENFETVRVRKDGVHINVSLTISPIRDSNGKTIGLSTIARDITAQKKAREELAETQRKLTTLIGHMPGFAYRCANDPDWTMEYLTEGFFLLTGYKPKELINNNVIPYSSLIVPEHRKHVWDNIQKALAKKEQYVLEYRIRTKQGKEKWVWEKGSGVFDDDGKLIALEGFILNITERKKSEETKSLLASIVDSSNDAIVSDTADGIILSWNSGAEKMYGYTKDEIIGKHFSIVVPPECKSEIENILNKINRGESIENYETIRMRKDGKRICVSLTISPLKNVNGIVTGICGIARDITVQRELQKELEKAKQREQHEKEIKSLEELARLPKKPDVTVQLFGLTPLQKSVPGIFNDLVERYEVLIDKALEDDQSTSSKNVISDELRIIGDELCTLKAGPSDVMEIHSKVMKNRNKDITSANAQAFAEKTRFMVLELMGHLVSYYRKHSLIYKEASSSKSTIKM